MNIFRPQAKYSCLVHVQRALGRCRVAFQRNGNNNYKLLLCMRTQDEVRTHFFNFPRRTSRCNARREEKRTFKSSALAACCYIVKRAIQFVCTIIRVRFIIAALGASASASLASRESSRDQTNQQQQQQLHLLIVD